MSQRHRGVRLARPCSSRGVHSGATRGAVRAVRRAGVADLGDGSAVLLPAVGNQPTVQPGPCDKNMNVAKRES